jgi:alkylhydroperoxidase/carboxymuconolactone decarboxylase family protein YurZ
MAAKRGYRFPEWEWLAEKDPAYEQARLDYGALIFTRENPALPVKYRELIASVILAFRGFPTVGDHVRRAIREGATMQEVIEAFEVATVPGGMPVMHFALPYLIEIDKELSGKQQS